MLQKPQIMVFLSGSAARNLLLQGRKVILKHHLIPVLKNGRIENQIDYQKALKILGHQYFVVKTIKEFFTIINNNLSEVYKQAMLQDLQNTFTEEQLIKQYQIRV